MKRDDPASLVPAAEDIAARQAVWEALSDLFLDTDTARSRQWRIEQLAQSRYSIEHLEFILGHEVYPVCRYNLMSVAGEWAGFDADWLQHEILRRQRSPLGFLSRWNLWRFNRYLAAEWQATRQGVLALRARGVNNQPGDS